MNTIEERVIKLISEFFGTEDVTAQTRLVEDLAADSLDTVEVLMAVEDEFDIEIPDEAGEKLFDEGSSVKTLIDYITEHTES